MIRRETLEQANSIAIFGHDNPDGDAIGSMLWLGWLLEKMGKIVEYFTAPLPSRMFSFLPEIEKIKSTFEYKNKYDLIVFVDFSPYERTVFTKGKYDYFDQKPLLVMDHHLGNTPDHAIVLKDTQADSNCEWIFENTKEIRSQYYDSQIASYLYLGIITDTGNFQYDKQGSRTLRNAAELVELGADKQWLTDRMFRSLKLGQLQFLSHIVPRFYQQDRIWSVWYTKDEYEQFGLDREEMAWYVTSIMSRIENIDLTVIGKIEDTAIKLSFRSKSLSMNAAALAESFGWGGHFYAAGAKVMIEPWQSVEQAFQDVIKRIYIQCHPQKRSSV